MNKFVLCSGRRLSTSLLRLFAIQMAWKRQSGKRLPVLLFTRFAEMERSMKNCLPTLSAYHNSTMIIRITIIIIAIIMKSET